MKKFFSIIAATTLLVACGSKNSETGGNNPNATPSTSEFEVQPNEVMASINLTVAEGKKLIALGIANHPQVKQKLASGTIIITRGTTNTYIAEKLAGLNKPHGTFMTGNVIPADKEPIDKDLTKLPELVLVNGKQVDMKYDEALASMKEGDIIFKGANMLNYEKKQAAVCVAAAGNGTVGKLQPYVGEGKVHLIVPIGLEKEVYGDLTEYEKILDKDIKRYTFVPRLVVHKNAEIFTEIEAIKLLGNVRILPYASGGIAGREGGISLAIVGDSTEIKKVLADVASIQGEAPFVK